MNKIKDLSGKIYGRLTVISFNCVKSSNAYWNCVCVCGKRRLVRGSHLIGGRSLSCGCYQMDQLLKVKKTHGESRQPSKEYITWRSIKARCLNKKNKRYDCYGGRGITVCGRWLHSYENFLADMGRAPSIEHSIDRINNNGNYEPSNCRWATVLEQIHNRRPKSQWRLST